MAKIQCEYCGFFIEEDAEQCSNCGAVNENCKRFISETPKTIEAYDISNIAGAENVAGMVVFADGRPQKSAYRKFKIKSFKGQDDFRSLAEVLDRRFIEYEKGTDEAFSRLPDLILLDGGAGQLSVVLPVLERHGINVPIFGMVKDNKHRTNAIAAAGGNISIKANRSAFSLITTISTRAQFLACSVRNSLRNLIANGVTLFPACSRVSAPRLT